MIPARCAQRKPATRFGLVFARRFPCRILRVRLVGAGPGLFLVPGTSWPAAGAGGVWLDKASGPPLLPWETRVWPATGPPDPENMARTPPPVYSLPTA